MTQATRYRGCNYCKHFRADGGCSAFDPNPIPLDIVSGQTKHIFPVLGQNSSIVYEDCEKSIFQRLMDQEEQEKALKP
jgi:O-acetyl-ADP-ribose deacetylase